MNGHALEVVKVDQQHCFELVAPLWMPAGSGVSPSVRTGAADISALGADWPLSSGAVRHAVSGQLEALHFAPGRWLLPDSSIELLAAIAGQPAAVLVDVQGKWQRRSLRGSGALRLLAAAADIETMLMGRDCAAVVLFDCPAIVARGSATIELWVQSSYARFLDEQLANARSRGHSRC